MSKAQMELRHLRYFVDVAEAHSFNLLAFSSGFLPRLHSSTAWFKLLALPD